MAGKLKQFPFVTGVEASYLIKATELPLIELSQRESYD